MVCFFQRYIMPLFVSTIVFIKSMLKAGAAKDNGEWSSQYGHFFPILHDGVNSLRWIFGNSQQIMFYYILFFLGSNG